MYNVVESGTRFKLQAPSAIMAGISDMWGVNAVLTVMLLYILGHSLSHARIKYYRFFEGFDGSSPTESGNHLITFSDCAVT